MSLSICWIVSKRSYIPYSCLLLICSLSILFSLVDPERAAAKTPDHSTGTALPAVTAIQAIEPNGGEKLTASQALEVPAFSHTGGFYTSTFQLELSSQEVGASIYYTLDGSAPTVDGSRYETPLAVTSRAGDPNVLSMIRTTTPDVAWMEPTEEIFKATTIRARVIRNDGEVSPIVTHTYFVDPSSAARYSLPVISIVSDAANFFDPEIGIYVPGKGYEEDPNNPNYVQSGRSWERPVHIELFAENGTRVLAQNAGIRTHGGRTRHYQSKSLRFYARNEYDDSIFNVHLFPDRPFSNYQTFILRNAGSDWSIAHYRDGLIHRVVEPLALDIQAFRPVIAFLNGEYWGILNMRERQDAEYLQTHYGIPTDAVDMLELPDETSEGSDDHYRALIAYVETNGANTAESYAHIQAQMDIENFIDYNIVEIFSSNTDWPHNNVENWRYQANMVADDTPYGFDGRWRWFIKDMDFGFGGWYKSADYEHNMLKWATSPDGNGYGDWSTLLLRALLENDSFRYQFINRFADLMNTVFDSKRVQAISDEIAASLAPELPEHIRRYRQPASMDKWQTQVQVIREFIELRPAYQRQHLVDFFNLEDDATVELNVSHASAGRIRVNSLLLNSQTPGASGNVYPWNGIYFQNVPVIVTAIPNFGYRFVEWDGLPNEQLASKASVELLLTGELNLTAHFEQTSDVMTLNLPQVAR